MKDLKISHSLPSHIDRQHTQLKLLLEEVSTLIKNKNKEFEREETSVDFVDFDNDGYELETSYLEEQKEILKGITQTLFSSMFVSVYSLLETNLSSLIKEIETITDHRIKSKHLKRDGSFINCSLNYLKLVQNLDLNSFEETIEFLNDITIVRNVFTHTRGIVSKENKGIRNRVLKFINDNDGIELKDNFIVITDEGFIDCIIEKNNSFFMTLINHINRVKT